MNVVKRFLYNNCIPFIGELNKKRNIFVNVIYYHDIVKGEGQSFMQTNVDTFRKQMNYIAENKYRTLTFDELNNDENLRFEKGKIVIAFDDGWVSNYTEIFDYMESLNLRYNVFLTIGEIGENPDYLTWDMVRKMHSSGLVGFGGHTFTHPHIADMTGVDQQLEFDSANDVFQKELGYSPEDFCYPYGSCSEISHEYLVNHTSYKRIYTSSMMYSYMQNDCVIFGRNGISNDETFGVYKAKLNGLFNVWNVLVQCL